MRTGRTLVLCLIVVLMVSLSAVTSAASPECAGPPELAVTERDNGGAVLIQGEVLVVKLAGNPSTGYGWQVRRLDPRLLRQVEADEWLPDTDGKLGGPGIQVLRFASVGKGETTLDLVYARPWEQAAPANTFALTVKVAVPSGEVSPAQPAADEAPAAAGGPQATLLSAHNWCNQGGCTAVRDQGQCGSCWAFGTVGPLESAIKIAGQGDLDLSEQWLVSCNTDGWGCNGGWWAHDYHVSPGAVYEADFRYKAQDLPCGGSYTHHEQIASWSYIGGQQSVPSTDAIKQAILDHGPVSAAVCVNTAWQNYQPGTVFNPANSCRTMNHAIVLVGWDDNALNTGIGAWLLRNSWGTSWGNQGYMWIAYGKNNVGYSANYVVYGGTPPPPTPAAPSNLTATAVSSSQINLSWVDNSSNETGFKVERCQGSNCTGFAEIGTVGAGVTAYQDTGLAARTTFRYRVRAYNDAGNSPYSNIAKATTKR